MSIEYFKGPFHRVKNDLIGEPSRGLIFCHKNDYLTESLERFNLDPKTR